MPAHEHLSNQFKTLYRGLTTHPDNVDYDAVGPHWTESLESAYNFATNRDVWGWSQNEDYEEGEVSHGVILQAKVHSRNIMPNDDNEAQSMAVMPKDSLENETFLRDRAPVHIEALEHITTNMSDGRGTEDSKRTVFPKRIRGRA